MAPAYRSFAAGVTSDLMAAKKECASRYLVPAPASALSARMFSGAADPHPKTNVVGVGIGEMIDGDAPTGVLAVKFFVRQKFAPHMLSRKETLPTTVNGMPTDVEEIGDVLPLAKKPAAKPKKPAKPKAGTGGGAVGLAAMPNPKDKFRPAQPGCSIGFQFPPPSTNVMAGTFGAVVRDAGSSSGPMYVLSNNHVIADENRLPLNSPIFQPGLLDGGNPATDRIAELTRFVALDPVGTNKVDGAIAKALSNGLVSRDVLYIGPPAGTASAAIDMIVHKFGRTTSYTVGRITSVATDVTVRYDMGVLTFEDQIIIRGLNSISFSASGDSGSLILQRGTNLAVGLLFAGSASHTIANHIGDVLSELSIRLA